MFYERANVSALDTGLFFFCASTKKKTKSVPDGVKDFDSYIKGWRTSLIHWHSNHSFPLVLSEIHPIKYEYKWFIIL